MTEHYEISSFLLENLSKAMNLLCKTAQELDNDELNQAVAALKTELNDLPNAFSVNITVNKEKGLRAIARSD